MLDAYPTGWTACGRYLSEFYRIAVRVANKKLWITDAPAAVADCNVQLAQLSFGFLNVGYTQSDVTIVARRIGVSGHLHNAHQMELMTIAEIVPATGEAEVGARESAQPEHVFVKFGGTVNVSHKKSGMMKSCD
jgi:hypothetical protein